MSNHGDAGGSPDGLVDLPDVDTPSLSAASTSDIALHPPARDFMGRATEAGATVGKPRDPGLVDLDAPEVAVPDDAGRVFIRSPWETIAEIPFHRLTRPARVWPQILRNRDRWKDLGPDAFDLAERVRDDLASMGLTDGQLEAIADAGLVEVGMPYREEETGWEARVFPWEAILSAATKPMRGDQPLCVVRHLRIDAPDARDFAGKTAMYVESVPRDLRSWNFDGERGRVRGNLKGYELSDAIDLTRDEMIKRLQAEQPGVIHVAGFDTWQGATLLNLPYSKGRRDGLMMIGRGGGIEEVHAVALGGFLASLARRPRMIALNLYNSGARLAPMAVAGGAGAAVGFQDVIDDDLAEQFFARFYEAYSSQAEGGSYGYEDSDPNATALRAFLAALAAVRGETNRVVGSGIVLWRDTALRGRDDQWIPPRGPNAGVLSAPPVGPPPPPAGGMPMTCRPGSSPEPPPPAVGPPRPARGPSPRAVGSPPPVGGIDQPQVRAGSTWPFATPEVLPYEKLNYAMLHNRSEVFERFLLRRNPGSTGGVQQLTVRVELYLAAPSPCSWEKTFDVAVGEEPLLHAEIRLPLISDLQRSLRHSLLTNMKVRIEHRNRCYFQVTFPVELLAIDEWRDDDQARVWLPSFVLPGDPEVPRVVDSAQRYLTTLVDEAGVGFDGYQRLGRMTQVVAGAGIGATPTPADVVDAQVRAIWSTLWLDDALRYINEPPTYTHRSQRIRPPSKIFTERRGTCIDLALLVAACLEHIDLYPVIFLLRGHALPGYWRSPVDRGRMTLGLNPSGADPTATSAPAGGTSVRGRRAPWYFDQSTFPDVRNAIDSGALVPLEAVDLTRNMGFRRACDDAALGIQANTFESMMDVRLAREYGVTPLPISKDI
jgi:hypothetical protein